MKEDIFNPRVVLSRICDAGVVVVKSKCTKNIEFTVNSGSPFQCAYDEAFSLAITSDLPLWYNGDLLYSPKHKKESDE